MVVRIQQAKKENDMETWALWTFVMLAFNSLVKILAVALVEYPREQNRISDVCDLIGAVVWLLWGAHVLF
jgi:uncharacterized protein YpmS